jgi:5'-3' exonuclease
MPKAPAKKTVAKKAPAKKEVKKRLILLDSHAIIHRAYHALPDFTSPTGEPTGALYGLSSMLLRIIQDLKPDYIAACYDLPKATFRHEAYEAYKGTRSSLDEALTKQLNTSRNVFAAFSIPIFEKEGFEADDILGTIADMTRDQKDIEIIIASGDMDTLQLIEKNRVKVYTLKKGLNDTILYDEKAVEERYGFPPKMVADYKGLRGDPSDNIIGIPGIGEKTATELIQKFGTIEDIYKKLKKNEAQFTEQGIKPRIVGLLKEHEEDAIFSKMLATIRVDAPITFKLPEAVWQDGSALPKVLALFDELGFRTLRGRARAVFEKGDPEGVAASVEADEERTAANEDIDPTRLQEAQVMVWLLASDLTNPTLDDVLAYTKAQTFDVAYKTLESKIATTGQLDEVYANIEKPLIPVLREMETHGVLIDTVALGKLGTAYHAELSEVEKRIYGVVGHEFNIASPKQLGDVLFDELGLKTPGAKSQKKTATGQRSTKESELEKLAGEHPIIADIMEYRQIQKLLGTYIDNIPPLLDANKRLHPQFIQTGAVTGRMATQNPSIQNIPVRTERGRAITLRSNCVSLQFFRVMRSWEIFSDPVVMYTGKWPLQFLVLSQKRWIMRCDVVRKS